MGKDTGIGWTDSTFNPWWGCTEVSPGCDNCYARELDARWYKQEPHWGKGIPRRSFGDKHWNEPLHWNKAAEKAGKKHRVFCASMADIMDDEAPEGQRERLWKLIDETPWLTWQLLTKRPHRYGRYLPASFKHNNVWLGVTAENQEFFDIRWPILQEQCRDRGLISWISYEPAIGPLSMWKHDWKPDWMIFGGETGKNRRLCEEKWAEDSLSECRLWGIRFYMKQMGGKTPIEGKAAIPSRLLVHQFPA